MCSSLILVRSLKPGALLCAAALLAGAPAVAQTAIEYGGIGATTTGVVGASVGAARGVVPAPGAPNSRNRAAGRTQAAAGGAGAGAGAGAGHCLRSPVASGGEAPLEIGRMNLTVGKSTLLQLPAPIDRISVGNPAVADMTLISNCELYLLGKTFGSTNVMLWRNGGPATVLDITVALDTDTLTAQMRKILPKETAIEVGSAADSIILAGTASGPLAAQEAVLVAEGYMSAYSRGLALPIIAGSGEVKAGQQLRVSEAEGGGSGQMRPKVINLMRIAQPAQVMLEVKVAEISKTLLDKLGSAFNLSRTNGSWRYGILSNLLSDLDKLGAGIPNALSAVGPNGKNILVDGENRDGLVKILAEPNIVAISGQEASFLAGGKIFIPVGRTEQNGLVTIRLEEKEFGVGLKFTPNVLDGGRINLKVAPEVSELNQAGNPFVTSNNVTTVLPSFTTRRAQTTVQLMDGQSLAIAGLIKNNVKETMSKFPLLGDLPILGALFRSSEFQTDRTELIFLITPRLVKPIDGDQVRMPTDHFRPPSAFEFFGLGQMEGSGHADVPLDERRPGEAGARALPVEIR